MKIVLIITFATVVNIIVYCASFIAGFYIGKSRAESEDNK